MVVTAPGSEEIRQIKESVSARCARFDPNYWRSKDDESVFPQEFYRETADDGWLGIALPEDDGGAGLGITAAAALTQTVAESGGGIAARSSIHIHDFGINPVVVFGTKEQKRSILPPLIAGERKACFAVTEPNAGLDTGSISTKAVREGDTYYVTGETVWISIAQVADDVMLLRRTTPVQECTRPIDGLSRAVDSNSLVFDRMPIPAENLIGKEGQGFRQILHGMNPERILVAAEAIGLGRIALDRVILCNIAEKKLGLPRSY
jgi:acyl-CoA dehydrogenase